MVQKSYNDTTRFVLPLLGHKKEDIITEYFINAYFDDYFIVLKYKQSNQYLDTLDVDKEIKGTDIYYHIAKTSLVKLNEDKFVNGKYSKFSVAAKTQILEFWNSKKGNRLHFILYPKLFHYEQGFKTLQYKDKEIWGIPNTSNYYIHEYEPYSSDAS